MDSPESQSSLRHAAEILRSGGTVAFPTETVYGLGANALNEAAVANIFLAKQRPAWDPLIVHVCDQAMLARVAGPFGEQTGARAGKLMKAFWPGPITLLLPKQAAVPSAVTAGRSRVGVRMPQHPVALELIRLAEIPVAAPSANLFGNTSPTRATHVLEDLDGRIDAVLDGGPSQVGVESTVLDVSPEDGGEMLIYREGAITLEQIEVVAGAVRIYTPPAGLEMARQEGLPSPGVGLRHYAPRARLVLVQDAENLQQEKRRLAEAAETIGVMLPLGWTLAQRDQTIVFPWGPMGDVAAQSRTLFAGLRELDAKGATVILCPLPAPVGLGLAMRDRLLKASRQW